MVTVVPSTRRSASMHAPVRHPFGHGVAPGTQAVPPLLQVSTVLPSHRVAPAVHGASHRPFVHVPGQFEVKSQPDPCELHVSTCVPLQRVEPDVHVGAARHTPEAHPYAH